MVDLSKRSFFTRIKVDESTIHLPWIAQTAQFTDLCTRCEKCKQACETNIIIKGDGGYPTVDFTIDECTFCYQCADVCPEPIFLSQENEPWSIKAVINEGCLAQQNIECRSCLDMCDSMAIQFQLEIGKVAQPNIELDKCTGCGACVSVCPSSSISVSN